MRQSVVAGALVKLGAVDEIILAGHRPVRVWRECEWVDAGTHDSLHDASSFVPVRRGRRGMLLVCPEDLTRKSGRPVVPPAAYIAAEPSPGPSRNQ